MAGGAMRRQHMARKIAINGFGRIGRLVCRQAMEMGDVEVVAVNDISPLDNLVYLLTHDSVQARPQADISFEGSTIHWDGQRIQYLSQRDPADLPWRELGVELVVEASGHFTTRDGAARHLDAGASHVIVTAPAK